MTYAFHRNSKLQLVYILKPLTSKMNNTGNFLFFTAGCDF